MPSVSAISQQIWDMKYRLKSPEGAAVDKTIEDTWRRIARALAEPERDPGLWIERFYEALSDFRFLPAGRVVAGAGTKRNVTLFNCFVMGTIPDDMSGIFTHLREAALTMQQGGGIGYDFSTLRPKGAPVKGVGADASGPLSFMDVWDAMCRTIMSAGYRRGAMMATLRCDHPDIEAFIEAKREPGRLRMFNLSVLVTDAFMQAVKEDSPWELKFGGTTFKVLPARELWDKIMRATYSYAEPGVIFIDRINRRNNLYYCETISATNPCVAGETWIQTAEGPRQVTDLVGKRFTAVVDGERFASGPTGFFRTGRKPVLRLTTDEGYSLRLTADHRVRVAAEQTRFRTRFEWREASQIRAGDLISLHDHRSAAEWAGRYTEAEGYLVGHLMGDGVLKDDKAVLSVWGAAACADGTPSRPGVSAVMSALLDAARTLRHRADFTGWISVSGRGEHRLAVGALRSLALELGLSPGNKAVTPAIERASGAFYRGFLRGFFDADGTVIGDQQKGVSVRLSQSDLRRLEAVQRMLARLGIVSQIYRERRPEGWRDLPDGAGGSKPYWCAADHELVIARENLARFAECVGFRDIEKMGRLRAALASYRRSLNREHFTTRVSAVIADGESEVFDAEISGVRAFDANGLYVHNCGEQPLPPYGACLLGSINLASLVLDPFTPEARLDFERLEALVPVAVRMLDNVIDISRFPLEAQAEEARAKRRIGLGVTGLADALILCNLRYGSAEAVSATEAWLEAIERSAYLASAALAAEKGSFPLFDKEKYLASETVGSLDPDVQEAIRRDGIRNSLITSVAPTGTISILADNVSSGIEPVFSFRYTRSVLMPDGAHKDEEVSDHAYRLYRRLKGENAPLPPAFVDVETLSPSDHVVMQAAVQKYVDSSISKTINVPADFPFETFKDVYLQAYELGCKGCTTYRPNEITGAVLEAKPAAATGGEVGLQAELPLPQPQPKSADVYEAGGIVYMTQPLSRPEALPGQTYKIRWPAGEHAIYITINDIVQDGRRRPFEIFINSKAMEHYAWTVGLTRMISAVFRRGGDVSFVVEEMKAVFDPRGGAWMGGRYVPSLLAAIGDVIEQHMIDIGFLPRRQAREIQLEKRAIANIATDGRRMAQCPKCGEAALIRIENCDQCTSCGYSKCS